MGTTIEYTYVSDCEERTGTWVGARSKALRAGVDALDAVKLASGDCVYRAEETGDYYALDVCEVMELGAAALDGRQSEAYSIWCASSGREATEDEIAEVAS